MMTAGPKTCSIIFYIILNTIYAISWNIFVTACDTYNVSHIEHIIYHMLAC